MGEVQYPSKLIIYTCFAGHSSTAAGANMGGFPDGHAECVPLDRVFMGSLGDYNLDWTYWGVLGYDVR
ncbi:MAG: hypothetical protein GXY33_20900 [Phycisphaerae bacterium]|nr:hypothetical protein [Phycisphaerae bacterium]